MQKNTTRRDQARLFLCLGFAAAFASAAPQANAADLVDPASQAITQEIAGLSTPDAILLLAAAPAAGPSALDAARRGAPDAQTGAQLAQSRPRDMRPVPSNCMFMIVEYCRMMPVGRGWRRQCVERRERICF
jgi:hypothetical protein